MTGLLLLLFAAAQAPTLPRLAECIEQKDRSCVAAQLAALPGNPSADELATAARGYMLLGQNEECFKAISRAVSLRPEDFGLLMEQGWLYQRSGEQPSAVHSFLLAAKIKPNSPDVFYELGMSFFFAHEYARAQRHFTHSLELDSKNDRAAFMLGVVAIWNEDLQGAKAYFQQAIALRPGSSDYRLHYGVLLAKLGENEPALAEMLRAEKIDALNPLTHLNLGRTYRLQDKLAEARKELELAVQLRPSLSSAVYQLATVYRQLGDQTRARETLERFKKLSAAEREQPEDPIDAAVNH